MEGRLMKHIGDGIAEALGGDRTRISAAPIGEPPESGKRCDRCGDWAPAVWCVTRWMLPPMCDPCLEDDQNKVDAEQKRQHERRKPPLLIPKDPGSYMTPPGDRAALNDVSAWKPARSQPWLYLCGRTGAGKSHLAKQKIREHYTVGAAFINTAELVGLYRSCFDDDGGSQWKIDADYKKAPILVLDDLGAESVTSFAHERIFDLLEYRIERLLPTIITSNHSIGDLVQIYGSVRGKIHGERIGSRLAGQCVVVEVRAPDYRRSKK